MASYKAALSNAEYVDDEDCLLAVRGQRIPQVLGERITQLCVTRGIRYHPGFAEEFRGLLPLFTRALNARDIRRMVWKGLMGDVDDGIHFSGLMACVQRLRLSFRCFLFSLPELGSFNLQSSHLLQSSASCAAHPPAHQSITIHQTLANLLFSNGTSIS